MNHLGVNHPWQVVLKQPMHAFISANRWAPPIDGLPCSLHWFGTGQQVGEPTPDSGTGRGQTMGYSGAGLSLRGKTGPHAPREALLCLRFRPSANPTHLRFSSQNDFMKSRSFSTPSTGMPL